MTTIHDTYINALLADAAYVGGLAPGDDLSVKLKTRMTETLAHYINKNFSVVTQIESGGLSSFDATVWRANNEDGSPNLNGKLYITMRGTQEGADFLADVNLAITGSAQTHLADNVGDITTEAAAAGSDTVIFFVNWTLATNVENLALSGVANLNATGNTLANLLTGNAGDNVLMGNTANNTLTGAAGNDTLNGGAGTDILVGGMGNDTYKMGLGFGADTVQENDATAGNTDELDFLSGIATDQLWFRHVSNNLEISVIGTTDKATLSNWYLGGH